MTAATPVARAGTAAGAWSGAVRAEWVKLRSVRSTVASYAAIVAVLAVLGGTWLTLPDGDGAGAVFTALLLAELLVAATAVLAAAGEFSAATARSTFIAVPRRTLVLTAKLAVHGGAVLVLLVLGAAAGTVLATLTAPEVAGSPLDPLVLRAAAGTALALVCVVALGIAAGMLTRSPAGGVGVTLALLVLPAVVVTAPRVTAFLPGRAVEALVFADRPPAAHLLPPMAAVAVLVGEAVVAVLVAAVVLRRRDV
ncbi:hypothetical protein [Modestobacter sp. VKM Ac-2978]|uniref:hypothetical protein n=1 Tax=Modestobacter sp. VKM Ac-2978 TaxID=3004132 RepID=UPI0022AA13C6|nr:hypothetical protein [Modestobacter sp. VKM Ac-2978]MCZ2848833.1 hypothetical protein [Modestobacter sp. VKM Ac-2978]